VEETDIIKRAFDIAPECGTMEELKRRLIREGYLQVNAHLSGWLVRRQITGKLNRDPLHPVPKRLQPNQPD